MNIHRNYFICSWGINNPISATWLPEYWLT